MLSGTVPRTKSGAKASGNCDDGPLAITGADKAEKANHNSNPMPRSRTPNSEPKRRVTVQTTDNRIDIRNIGYHRDLTPVQIDLAAACTDSGKLSRKCEYPP